MPPPVLDNARDVVAEASDRADPVDGDAAGDTAAEQGGGDSVADQPVELPPPDPSTFRGALRVVNLWVGEGGETTPVDVWVRRSFTAGPVLLADDIRFGDATPYLAAPPGAEVVVVTAGAGPDGRARADLAAATAGEQLTTVFTNDDLDGTVVAPTLVERGGDLSLVPPTDDQGLIVVFAPNLGAFADRLEAELGGGSLAVGDGSSTCRTQRFEAEGFPAGVVGGVRTVELEVPAGPAAISLHPASSADCGQPSVLDLTVDMEPGAITIVLAFTRDGATIEALTLPVAPLT